MRRTVNQRDLNELRQEMYEALSDVVSLHSTIPPHYSGCMVETSVKVSRCSWIIAPFGYLNRHKYKIAEEMVSIFAAVSVAIVSGVKTLLSIGRSEEIDDQLLKSIKDAGMQMRRNRRQMDLKQRQL